VQKVDDAVNAPAHYVGGGRSVEPLSVIEDWKLGYHLGNALKYISRAGRKGNEIHDIRKGIYYLERYARLLERGDR
jgi:hypothetical protein